MGRSEFDVHPVNAPAWLTARPIAHRGLHDTSAGRVENTIAAAKAAIAGRYAIECDVQSTSDGEAVVFHDDELSRLMQVEGLLAERTAHELADLPYRNGDGRISALGAFLDTIAGQVPLIVEIKSRFDGDMRVSDRVQTLASAYAGPLAVKSFDPAVLVHLRGIGFSRPLGLVAEPHYDAAEWHMLSKVTRDSLTDLRAFSKATPDFLSWHAKALPHATPMLCRALGLPIMTWTVRTAAEAEAAVPWADQIVFESFRP